MDSFSAIH